MSRIFVVYIAREFLSLYGEQMTPTSLDKNNRCYSRTELKDYSLGRASEMVSIRIEEHLNECDICEDTIVALDSSEDTFVHQLRGVSAGTDHEKNSELDVLLAGAKKLVDQSMAVQPNGQSINGYQQIGEYELCELVGRGGMGQVYRARHSRLDKEFALKILSGKRFSNDEAIGRFQREMKIVGKLDHPSIVQATDAGEFDEVHYLTMEYVDGHNAANVLHHCDPLAVGNACEIVRQAAEGIEYAHQQDIVHRDIKPSNLMLNRKGQVKILDLGLATLRNINHSVDELTTVGQLMGTLDYMAPEQCDGQMVDHRCDIYSLGSTLYKLLTNRAPYSKGDNQSPLQKLRAMAVEDFVPITRHRDDLPSELVDIIHRCLDRDPENRYASAAELSEALKPFCDGHELGTLLKQTEKEVESAKSKAIKLDGSKAFDGEEYTDTVVSGSLQAQAGGQGSRIGIGWIAALIMLALVPLAWLSIQIIINWDKGQLVIESETGNVQVKLIKDGQPYKEMSLQQGANSTKIRAGKYEILIDDPSDQLVVTNGTFELKRGGTTIAKVVAKDGDGLEKSDPTKSPRIGSAKPIVSNDQPTFEGWTLNEWLEADIKDKTFDAVERLGVLLTANERRTAIEKIRNKYSSELSLNSQGRAFVLMSKMCNDSDTAEQAMNFFLEICAHHKPEEILNGNLVDLRDPDASRFLRIPLRELPTYLKEQKAAVDSCAIKSLKSENLSLQAFGMSWCFEQNENRKSFSAYRSSLLRLLDHGHVETDFFCINVIRRDFHDDEEVLAALASKIESISETNQLRAIYTLCEHAPRTNHLAQLVLKKLQSEKSIAENTIANYLEMVELLLRNDCPEILNELESLFEDPEWGWKLIEPVKGVAIQRQDNQPDVRFLFELIPDWKGEYMPGWNQKYSIGDDDADKLEMATYSTLRVEIIGTFDSKFEPMTKERLNKIANSQFDFRFNDHYLMAVGRTISNLKPEEYKSPIDFWLQAFFSAENDIQKNRILNVLGRSEITTGPGAFREIIRSMREFNCDDPNEKEIAIILQVAKLFAYKKFEKRDSFANLVNESGAEDFAFLVWVLKYRDEFGGRSRGMDTTRLNRQKYSEFANKFDQVESPTVLLRGIDILLADSPEAWRRLFEMNLNSSQRSAAYQMFAKIHADPSFRRRNEQEEVEIMVQLPISAFDTENSDDLYAMLRTLGFYEFSDNQSLQKHTEALSLEKGKTELVQLLINPTNALLSHGELLNVDLWGDSIQFNQINDNSNLRSQQTHKAPIYRLVEYLAYCRFIEANFDGQKDKIIANLKSLLPGIDNEYTKKSAEQLIFRIENSETITAFVQLDTLSAAATNYYLHVGSAPKGVDDLYERPEDVNSEKWQGPYVDAPGFKIDPWGNEFTIGFSTSKNEVVVRSKGPKGEFGIDSLRSGNFVANDEYSWLKSELARERLNRNR